MYMKIVRNLLNNVAFVAFALCAIVAGLAYLTLGAPGAQAAPVVRLVVLDQDGKVLFEEEAKGDDKAESIRWAQQLESTLPRDTTSVVSINMRSSSKDRYDVRMVVDTESPAPEWIRELRQGEFRTPMDLLARAADHLDIEVVITEGTRPIWTAKLETAMTLQAPPAEVEDRELQAFDLDIALSEDGNMLEGQLTFITGAPTPEA